LSGGGNFGFESYSLQAGDEARASPFDEANRDFSLEPGYGSGNGGSRAAKGAGSGADATGAEDRIDRDQGCRIHLPTIRAGAVDAQKNRIACSTFGISHVADLSNSVTP
jgi:hypothetical protein